MALRGIPEGVLDLTCQAPLPGGLGVETGCGTEIRAPREQRPPGIVLGQFPDPVPQHGGHGELRLADHGLGIDRSVLFRPRRWLVPGCRLRDAGPGQDVQVMQVRVDQDVLAGPPADGATGLADLQRRLEQPAWERPPEVFPRLREFIAPLLGPCRHVVDFPPLRPAVRDHAELADHAAPHRHRCVQRDIQEGAAGVQALQEQGAGTGVGGQQPDGAVASPQGEGVVFPGGLLMRKSQLQHGCLALALGPLPVPAPHRNDDAAVPVPGKGPRFQIRLQVPLVEESPDQVRKCRQPGASRRGTGVPAGKIRRDGDIWDRVHGTYRRAGGVAAALACPRRTSDGSSGTGGL